MGVKNIIIYKNIPCIVFNHKLLTYAETEYIEVLYKTNRLLLKNNRHEGWKESIYNWKFISEILKKY